MSTIEVIELSANVLNALLQDIAELRNRIGMLETNHIPAKPQQKPRANGFWNAYHAINHPENQPFNHANNQDDEVAINLSEFIQQCYTQGIDLPPKKQLIRQLKRERNYMGNVSIRSRIKGRTVRCYVFKRG